MSHEDYVPAPLAPDYTFDPATLYQTPPRPVAAKPPAPPSALSPGLRTIGLALALAGVVCVFVGERRTARAEATRGWIETSATIATAKLRARGGDYHLELAYRYRAGPREREGSRVALEPDLSRDAAYAYAERFRPGARVPAWFDPAAPESVVLERPQVPAAGLPGALGAILLLAGLAPFARQLVLHLRYRMRLRRAAAA